MPVEAIYARQSVDKKDSLSVEGQIDLCRKFVGEEAVVYEDREKISNVLRSWN